MKKLVFIVLLMFISISMVEKASARTFQLTDNALETVENQQLSIKQAIELAYPSALEWNEHAELLDAISIDLDKSGKSIGSNGKRKYWNISFGVPDTNQFYLVTIHEGKIDQANDLHLLIPKKSLSD